jgi:hypothetical protein
MYVISETNACYYHNLHPVTFDCFPGTMYIINSSCSLVFSTEPVMPMIPLGLKETKEIDFREPFKVSRGQYF